MSGSLAGRVALVTNASTALGYSIARRLGQSGAKVFLSDPNKTRLQHALDGMKGAHANIVSTGGSFDLTQEDGRAQLFTRIREEMGQLDIAILGSQPNQVTGDIMDSTRQEFDEMFSKYLTVPFMMAKEALPLMTKTGNGSIILISSIAGFTPFLDIGLYSAAQTGALGICKVLAQSLASRGIRVNAVCLGICDDDCSGASWSTSCGISSEEAVLKAETTRHQLRNLIPLGRTGRASDAVGVVEFLASDRSSYITGENICVNGGISVRV